jgi:hypothetical protein
VNKPVLERLKPLLADKKLRNTYGFPVLYIVLLGVLYSLAPGVLRLPTEETLVSPTPDSSSDSSAVVVPASASLQNYELCNSCHRSLAMQLTLDKKIGHLNSSCKSCHLPGNQLSARMQIKQSGSQDCKSCHDPAAQPALMVQGGSTTRIVMQMPPADSLPTSP